MATKTDNLTPQQETAADLLAFGATVTDAAATVKVSRQTVSEWLNHHAGFQAVLNARRRELFAENQERLRSLIPKALETLGRLSRRRTPCHGGGGSSSQSGGLVRLARAERLDSR